MKTGKTLAEVAAELQRQADAKRDYIAPLSNMRLYDDGHTVEIASTGKNEKMQLGSTGLFHKQMASVLGIPTRYYETMQQQKPELLAENVNAWLGDKDYSSMVRTMDYGDGVYRARALLSERYRRIDNLEIASAVLPLFAGNDQYEVASADVTPGHLFLKIVNHRLEKEVVPGDIVQAGVVVSNSEGGLGAVSIKPLVYRLVCSNGAIVDDFGERRTHVGRAMKAVEESLDIYSDETIEAENRAFTLRLKDATMAAIEESRFAQIVDKLRESVGVPITGRVQDVVELTGKTYGLTQNEQDGVLNYLIQGGDLSLYGLSNAVTRASQDIESYDRATDLEAIGWKVATMPSAQWREINA